MQKKQLQINYITRCSVAAYVDLVKAAGAVPSMQAVDSGYLNKVGLYQQDKFDYETVAGRIVFDWQYDDNSMFYASYARGNLVELTLAASPRTFKPCAVGESGEWLGLQDQRQLV